LHIDTESSEKSSWLYIFSKLLIKATMTWHIPIDFEFNWASTNIFHRWLTAVGGKFFMQKYIHEDLHCEAKLGDKLLKQFSILQRLL